MTAFIVRFPPLLLAALVLHEVVLPELRLFGVSAEVLVLVAVAAGLAGGPEAGAVIGFAVGLTADLFVQTPFGLSALVFSVAGYAVGRFQGTILRATWWIPVLTAAVASAAGVVAFAAAGAVLGQSHLVSGRLAMVAWVVALLNGVLSLVVVPAVRWALSRLGQRQVALR